MSLGFKRLRKCIGFIRLRKRTEH